MSSLDGQDALSGLMEDARHVGQIQLLMGIVRVELSDVVEQRLAAERVNTGVDLAQTQLLGTKSLLLDDGIHLWRSGRMPDHPPISERIRRLGGEDGHHGAVLQMEIAQGDDGLGAQQRNVS